MKSSSLILTATLAAALMTSCSKPQRPAETDLVVLYTTDVHGACLPFDFKRNAPARTSLANVCTYVNEVRKQSPDAVMLFDTGDFLQGQPSIYYSNFVDTTEMHIVARVNNYLKYDAIGVGNHDIEPGEDVYGRRLKGQFEMPWLCANAIDQRTLTDPEDPFSGESMFQPYTVIERQGIRIAVLGLITPNIHAWLPKSLWPNLEFQDMVDAASRWIPIIKEKEHPDLIFGLFHAGSDYTANGSELDTYCNENGSVPVAIKVPGLDLILCGHDHKPCMFNVMNVNGDSVPVIDAQTQAAKVGRIDFHMVRQADGSYKHTVTSSLIPMNEYPADEAFCREFQPAIDEVNAYVDAPIGEITAELTGINGLYGPCPFMDLIHDGQLWATGADISIATVLSPHDVVPAGPLTMRHLFSIYKYENQLFTIRMTGAEVKKYLEFGFDRQFAQMESPHDHLIAFKRDAEGNICQNQYGPEYLTPTFNFTSAAGIRYQLDIRKPLGNRVTILSMSDGSAFSLDREYVVALNSYQYSGGGDFIPKGLGWDQETLEARTVSTTPRDVRSYIADYIRQQKTITPHLRGDWEIIPTEWWEKGKARDMAFMNPNQR